MRRTLIVTLPLFLVLVALSLAVKADLVGVGFGAAPTDWNVISTPSTTDVNNLIDENGNTTGIDFSWSATTPAFFSGSLDPSSLPSNTPSLAGLSEDVYNGNYANGSLTATFSGLNADQVYDVYAFGTNFGNIPNLSQNVSITGSGGPTNFVQPIGDYDLSVNGSIGSSALSLDSYAILVTSSNTGTITFSVSGLNYPSGYQVSGFAISASPVTGGSSTPLPSGLLPGLLCLGTLAFAIRHYQSAIC